MAKPKMTGTETTVPFVEAQTIVGKKVDLRADKTEQLLGNNPPPKE